MKVRGYYLVAAVIAFYLLVLSAYSLGYTNNHVFDATVFIHAGEKQCFGRCDGLYVFPDSWGYDGIFYYMVAKDPFHLSDLQAVASPGLVAYRLQRILYPVLASVLSLGNVSFIPYALLAVNLISVASLMFSLRAISSGGGRLCSPLLYGALVPGVFLSVILDLAEPLWCALVAGAFLLLVRGQHTSAWVMLAFSGLAKETSVLMIPPIVAFFLYRRQVKLALCYSLAIVPMIIWQIILFSLFGSVPFFSSVAHSMEISWLIGSIKDTLYSGSPVMLPVYALMLIVPFVLYSSLNAFRKSVSLASTLLLFNSIVLIPILFKSSSWEDFFVAARTILPLTLSMILYTAENDGKRLHIPVLLQIMLTFLISFYYIIKGAIALL